MKTLMTFLLLLFVLPLQGQIAEIQGMVTDSLTEERLAGCQVRIVGPDTVLICYTDFDGFYAVKTNKMGSYSVEVACMDIKATVYDISVKIDRISFVDIPLSCVTEPSYSCISYADLIETQVNKAIVTVGFRGCPTIPPPPFTVPLEDISLPAKFGNYQERYDRNGLKIYSDYPRSITHRTVEQ
jgi:hypothetical protein